MLSAGIKDKNVVRVQDIFRPVLADIGSSFVHKNNFICFDDPARVYPASVGLKEPRGNIFQRSVFVQGYHV